MSQFIALLLLPLFLITAGFYCLFHKKKDIPCDATNTINGINALRMPDPTPQTHHQEVSKNTGWKGWFLEYWRGERRAFPAWVTWWLCGGTVCKLALIALFIIITALIPTTASPLVDHILEITFFAYALMAYLILWRCAKNSTPFNCFAARLFTLACFVSLLR